MKRKIVLTLKKQKTMIKGNIFGGEYTINGIDNLAEHFENDFEVIYDDVEDFFAVSKECFVQDDEDENSYKYYLAIQATECEGKQYFSLLYIVAPESLCKSVYKKIEDFCGCEVTPYDIASYGLGVTMQSTSIDVKEEYEEINMETIYHIANVAPTTNSLRGFYLDRCWNMIGNTGWDIIEECVNGTDMFKSAMECYKTQNKAE